MIKKIFSAKMLAVALTGAFIPMFGMDVDMVDFKSMFNKSFHSHYERIIASEQPTVVKKNPLVVWVTLGSEKPLYPDENIVYQQIFHLIDQPKRENFCSIDKKCFVENGVLLMKNPLPSGYHNFPGALSASVIEKMQQKGFVRGYTDNQYVYIVENNQNVWPRFLSNFKSHSMIKAELLRKNSKFLKTLPRNVFPAREPTDWSNVHTCKE